MRTLFLAAALLAQSAAYAQNSPTPPVSPAVTPPPGAAEARARLVAADTNKDGKWDKAEWTAAGRRERGFQMLDADSDGFVTQAELKDGMARMQAMRGTPN